MHKIAMLGTGLIGRFYTMSLQNFRGKDEIKVVCSSILENAKKFADEFGIPRWTDDMAAAIRDPEVDIVIIGIPNHLHKEAVLLAAEAGKAVLCTKPLAMSGPEALEMLESVEKAGVFHGYLEDLAYTPKTLKALQAVQKGALGKVLWARSRETHGGPHSDWFWTKELSGGGAIVDMGWLFPVGDEIGSLGYVAMFIDMFNSMDKGRAPMETFYYGYIVNSIIDASYKAAESKKWEPVEVRDWRGGAVNKENAGLKDYDEEHFLILKDKQTGKISQVIQ